MHITRNVLFICTGNAVRSIMAEAILAKDGGRAFRAFSAGSEPAGVVHPLTLRVLNKAGFGSHTLHSKSWDEFALPTAPKMDFVLTVGGGAGAEIAPLWPGHPTTAHWGIPDPAAVEGPERERLAAFAKAFNQLKTRIDAFVALPFDRLDKAEILAHLRAIRQLA